MVLSALLPWATPKALSWHIIRALGWFGKQMSNQLSCPNNPASHYQLLAEASLLAGCMS